MATAGGVLGCLVDQATECFDAVITQPRRKLIALALCAALEHAGALGAAGMGPLLHNRLSGVLGCCSEVILDDHEAESHHHRAAAEPAHHHVGAHNPRSSAVHVVARSDTTLRVGEKWSHFHAEDTAALRKVNISAALNRGG